MRLLVLMLPLNSLLNRALLQPRHLQRMLLPPPVLTQLSSPRLKLRPKLKLRLRFKHNRVQVPVLLLKPPPLPLVLMPLLALTHNILRNRNSKEVLPLMSSHREPAANALLDKLPRCNTPVPWPLMARYSIHPFQEANQLPSRSVT